MMSQEEYEKQIVKPGFTYYGGGIQLCQPIRRKNLDDILDIIDDYIDVLDSIDENKDGSGK